MTVDAALVAFADGFGIGGGCTTGAAGGTASATGLSAGCESWIVWVYVDCATAAG